MENSKFKKYTYPIFLFLKVTFVFALAYFSLIYLGYQVESLYITGKTESLKAALSSWPADKELNCGRFDFKGSGYRECPAKEYIEAKKDIEIFGVAIGSTIIFSSIFEPFISWKGNIRIADLAPAIFVPLVAYLPILITYTYYLYKKKNISFRHPHNRSLIIIAAVIGLMIGSLLIAYPLGRFQKINWGEYPELTN